MKQSEMKENITNIIFDYSQEFNIAPQFIEKDYYVVKVLEEISKIDYPNLEIIFSGGTCLSKAYNKIKRFSEDIDFRINTSKDFSRSDKKAFCNYVLEKLSNSSDYKIINDSIKKGNENNFFSFEIEYLKIYQNSLNLRPNIKVEFTFENIILPCQSYQIDSYIAPFINQDSVNIKCINPIEVIANKFSALMWRVFIKDRTKPVHTKENDPTIIRHLHDISALNDIIYNENFIELLNVSYSTDKNRGGIKNNYSLLEFARLIFDKLISDKVYKKEYADFVASMCFAKDEEIINFDDAMESLKNIIDYIDTHQKEAF